MKGNMLGNLVCLLVVSALASTASGEPRNMVLPQNGDDRLVVGPEHERNGADWLGKIRDGDWDTPAQTHGGQFGSLYTIVTFPECFIAHVGYHADGTAYGYDGNNAWAHLYVYVRQNDSWGDPIVERHVGGFDHYNVDVRHDDNGGSGWPNATGMCMYSEIWGVDTGSAGIAHYEMEAWAVPEPSTLVLLSVGAVGVLLYAWRKRRWR